MSYRCSICDFVMDGDVKSSFNEGLARRISSNRLFFRDKDPICEECNEAIEEALVEFNEPLPLFNTYDRS